MKEFKRNYQFFSLCGLACGLCPRHQTDSKSRCPGCGGKDFHLKHPSCAIITCSKKHDSIEYCLLCSAYPCERYAKAVEKDSFISYKNVLNDFEMMQEIGEDKFINYLNKKILILENLIESFNDGRKKNFYCLAVNLLPLEDLDKIMKEINDSISKSDNSDKDKINQVIKLFNLYSKNRKIDLSLRK